MSMFDDLPEQWRKPAEDVFNRVTGEMIRRFISGPASQEGPVKAPSVPVDEMKTTHAASPRPIDGTHVRIVIEGLVSSLPDGNGVIVINGNEEWWLSPVNGASFQVEQVGRQWR